METPSPPTSLLVLYFIPRPSCSSCSPSNTSCLYCLRLKNAQNDPYSFFNLPKTIDVHVRKSVFAWSKGRFDSLASDYDVVVEVRTEMLWNDFLLHSIDLTHLYYVLLNVSKENEEKIMLGWLRDEKTSKTVLGIELYACFKQRIKHHVDDEDVFYVSCQFESFGTTTINSGEMKTFARVGLLGNPSDGYNGYCLSGVIENYWAQASFVAVEHPKDPTLFPPSLILIPSPQHDGLEHFDLHAMSRCMKGSDYQGGLRLMQATCVKFHEMCIRERINLLPRHKKHVLKLTYDTNIPRQRGLAGSSAIVTSIFKVLWLYYVGVNEMNWKIMSKYTLEVEKDELKLTAGLQDRVAQAYNKGWISMNFSMPSFEANQNKYGEYHEVDVLELMRNRFLLVLSPLSKTKQQKTSSGVHVGFRERYVEGEKLAVDGMKTIANLAETIVKEMTDEVEEEEKKLEIEKMFLNAMNQNFDLRVKLFGELVAKEDVEVVSIARSLGCAAKLPGSGGSVLIAVPNKLGEVEAVLEKLKKCLSPEAEVVQLRFRGF